MCERVYGVAIYAVVKLQNSFKDLFEQVLPEIRANLGEITLFVYYPWKRLATYWMHVPNEILQPTHINETFYA